MHEKVKCIQLKPSIVSLFTLQYDYWEKGHIFYNNSILPTPKGSLGTRPDPDL